MKKKNDWIKKGILIIVLLVCIAAYLWVPGIHKTMNQIFKMFASGDFTVVRDFVASYGVYAALMSFLLMIFQADFFLFFGQQYHALKDFWGLSAIFAPHFPLFLEKFQLRHN